MQNEENIAELLIKWYKNNGRNYPWRTDLTPYKILIAEIMLQRTKADQVSPIYLCFLKEFPHPQIVFDASEEKISGFFSRLGLIRRAKLLKLLIKELILNYDGKIPENREELISLPAIGEYTADAVLSFAYDKDLAVVDSNVCRIIGRIFNLKSRGESRRDPQFRKLANDILPYGKSKEFNWAMIDLGALICRHKKPLCDKCPIKKYCNSYSVK